MAHQLTVNQNKLTDNQLAQLYLGFSRDYVELSDRGMNVNEIYQELYSRLHYSLVSPNSTMLLLNETEKNKARKVLNTFFSACPHYQRLAPAFRHVFYLQPCLTVINHYPASDCHYYCHSDDALFNWMLLSSFMSPHTHHHGSRGCDSDNKGLAYIIGIILLALVAILTLVAFYYMLSTFLNSIERFVYNEGWFKAGLNIAGILGGGAAGACLGIYIVAIPLIVLGIGLGLSNPLGLAIAGAVCLSIVGAALFCAFTNWVYPDDKDALDPKDAHRFAVTDEEAEHMLTKGIDPVKVKCAIVALRQELGKDQVPSLLERVFTKSGGEKQKLLQQVRQLRRGELTELKVGTMHFNFESPELAVANDAKMLLNAAADDMRFVSPEMEEAEEQRKGCFSKG